MFYAAVFVIVLIVVSGAIAYIGDVMGRRMGKRRLTLFGLRPRHTAIVVTTITGMLIAALTLATLLGVNHQVRWAMVKGQVILKRNRELAVKNKSLREDNQQLRTARRELTDKLTASQKELRKANETGVKLDAEIVEARDQLDETKVVLRNEQIRLSETRDNLATTKKQLEGAQEEVTRIRRRLLATGTGYETLRGKPIILESGEEIARTVVNPRSSIPAMRLRVIDALTEADKAAEKLGAARGKNGRAVVIVSKKIKVPSPKGGFEVKTYDELKSIGFIADALSSSPSPVVLQIVVAGNAVEGEQVLVEARLFKNKLVFSAGRTIAEVILDASKDRTQLLNDLAKFLLSDVRKAATQAGVIPVTNPHDPEKLFGEVGADRLLEVLEKVKRLSGDVPVKAIAQRDVYAAGPLLLDFVVGKSQD